ncbi:mevalonate kinase-like [Styela clava]
MTEISVSAPGKIILHGEHSVVHGKKAIACAIESRVFVRATTSNSNDGVISVLMSSLHDKQITVQINEFCFFCDKLKDEENPGIEIEKYCAETLSEHADEFMRLAMSCLLYAYYKVFLCSDPITAPHVSLIIESQLPIGAGLGSSAAYNTSVACILLLLSGRISTQSSDSFIELKNENSLNKINELAYEMEKIVHKTPSGIDNSIATYGGAVLFEKGILTKLENMPKLQLLIVDSQVQRNTKTLVSNVEEFLNKFPDIVNPILDAMHGITLKSEILLKNIHANPLNHELLNDLGKLIITNQCLLCGIGVGHPTLDKICLIAKKFGFPAKLTGAGGGGCAIILLHTSSGLLDSNVESMVKVLTDENFICKKAMLGAGGIMTKYTHR